MECRGGFGDHERFTAAGGGSCNVGSGARAREHGIKVVGGHGGFTGQHGFEYAGVGNDVVNPRVLSSVVIHGESDPVDKFIAGVEGSVWIVPEIKLAVFVGVERPDGCGGVGGRG